MGRALVRQADGVVVNIIEWDGDTKKWSPPDGCIVLDEKQTGMAGVGDTWDGAKMTPRVVISKPDYKAQYTAASTTAAKIDVLAKAMGLK